MKRRPAELEAQTHAGPRAPVSTSSDTTAHSVFAQRLVGPHSREEAEARYVAARDEWTKAMRAASSGRPADLASLAFTQETFEAAAAERERWISGIHVAIPIESDEPRRGLEAAIGQEMAWRKVRLHKRRRGILGWLRSRLNGR